MLDELTTTKVVAKPVSAQMSAGILEISWTSGDAARSRLRFALDRGTPVVREIAVRRGTSAWRLLATNVTPEFRITTGLRRVTNSN